MSTTEPTDGTAPNRLSWRSEGSVLSICSRGSVLSVASVGSFASIGSVGSALSLFSAGSWMSVASVLSAQSRSSVMSARSARAVLADRASGTEALGRLLIAGAAAAVALSWATGRPHTGQGPKTRRRGALALSCQTPDLGNGG